MPTDNPFGAPVEADDTFEVELTEDEGYRVPKGKYPAKCVSLEKATSQSGNPMWVWEFVITHGKYAGRSFKLWTALTASAMWKLRETLEGLGLGKGGAKAQFKKTDAINRPCTVELEDSEYQGRKQSSIGKVLPFDPAVATSVGPVQGRDDLPT